VRFTNYFLLLFIFYSLSAVAKPCTFNFHTDEFCADKPIISLQGPLSSGDCRRISRENKLEETIIRCYSQPSTGELVNPYPPEQPPPKFEEACWLAFVLGSSCEEED
jgi:hypothetical protein